MIDEDEMIARLAGDSSPEEFRKGAEAALAQLHHRESLEPEIIAAIDQWMISAIHERRGPGKPRDGGAESYSFQEMLAVLNELCPDVVARMLQAGAANYIQGRMSPVDQDSQDGRRDHEPDPADTPNPTQSGSIP